MVGIIIIIIIITMVENQEADSPVSKHVRVLASEVCEPSESILNTLISSCYY